MLLLMMSDDDGFIVIVSLRAAVFEDPQRGQVSAGLRLHPDRNTDGHRRTTWLYRQGRVLGTPF